MNKNLVDGKWINVEQIFSQHIVYNTLQNSIKRKE